MKINTNAKLCPYRNASDLRFHNTALRRTLLDYNGIPISTRYCVGPIDYEGNDDAIMAYMTAFWGAATDQHISFQVIYRDKATHDILKYDLLCYPPVERREVDSTRYLHIFGHIVRMGIQTILEISAHQESAKHSQRIRKLGMDIYTDAVDFFRPAYYRYTKASLSEVQYLFQSFPVYSILANYPVSHALKMLEQIDVSHANPELAEFDCHSNCQAL